MKPAKPFKTVEQQRNATQVFESWELILFDKLKRNGTLDKELIHSVLMDFSAAYVPRQVASEYLQQQIADMVEQIAEQKSA